MEQINIPETTDRAAIYTAILPQIQALVACETDLVANMGNMVAVLKEAFGFFWVGFYVVQGDDLVLSAFQGTVACTRIARGRGVCGAAWAQARTIIVADVRDFAGHIACSAHSKSEIVVAAHTPHGGVWAVLDIDSDKINDFTTTDQFYLERIVGLIMKKE